MKHLNPYLLLATLFMGSLPCWASEPSLTNPGQAQKDEAPSAQRQPFLGGLTYFSDRAAFNNAFLGSVTEDFELGAVAGGGLVACPAPVDATGDGTCFAPGAIVDGIVFEDVPGPNAIDGLLLIGDGTFGNSTRVLSSNILTDSLEIFFPEPVEAVSLDLLNLPGPADFLTVDVYGPNDLLVASVSTASSPAGGFFGLSSMSPIERLVLTSTINQAEGVDNVTFSVAPFLVLDSFTTTDSCPLTPANDNGIWEPGEEIEIDVVLRASASGFTNISGTISATDPGLVLFDTAAIWPDMAAGTTAASTTPLRFTLADSALCGNDVELTLNVTSDQGNFAIPLFDTVGAVQAPDVPQPIPDGALAGVASTLNIGTNVNVSNLEVAVDVSHTWVGDVTLTLMSPMGTTVTLLDRPGVPMSAQGCNNNDIRVTFTDTAMADPENFCNASSSDPWIGGVVSPASPLSAFDGEPANGTWTLTVRDNLAGDLGTLQDWSLINADPLGADCQVCNAESDLQLTKSCVGVPNPGCVLEVTNLGTSTAFGVQVVDPFPAPLTWVSDDCDAGPTAPGPTSDETLTWDVGNLDVGETVTCNIALEAPPSFVGTLLNVATVDSQSMDPALTNNTAEETFVFASVTDVPTLSTWGLIAMILALAGLGLTRLDGRRSE